MRFAGPEISSCLKIAKAFEAVTLLESYYQKAYFKVAGALA